MNEKTIHKYREEKGKWTESGKCHPQKLPEASDYIEQYWLDVIRDVNSYEKKRGLQTVHKLLTDGRIIKGYKLYKEGHIKSYDITKRDNGDVKAVVESEDGEKDYTVIMKNWKPSKDMLRYRYEREKYIANLYVRCECKDSTFGHYRSNSSIFCKHTSAVWWMLQEEFNAPRIFVTKEQKKEGMKRAEIEEIDNEIEGIPMKKFTPYLNILQLKEFRGKKPSVGLSIHRRLNEPERYRKEYNPIWITFTNPEEVKRVIEALKEGYKTMTEARKNNNGIMSEIKWWINLCFRWMKKIFK